MRNLLICTLALLCLVSCSHEKAPPEPETTTLPETTYIKVFSPEDAGIFAGPYAETDFVHLWEESTHVLHATVSAIGEAYLYDGSTVSPSDSEKTIVHKLTKIRTPLTLTVTEDFKGALFPGDELILTEFWGEMNGYLMKSKLYTPPVLGGEYIFFITPLTDSHGEIFNCAQTHGSVRVNIDGSPDFEPLFSPYLYEPYANSTEIIAAIRALGEAS